MGTIRVPDDASGAAFVRLFANTPIDVAVTDRFAETAWRKLAINCAGAVNALALRPAVIALDDDVARYANVARVTLDAITAYADDVRGGRQVRGR